MKDLGRYRDHNPSDRANEAPGLGLEPRSPAPEAGVLPARRPRKAAKTIATALRQILRSGCEFGQVRIRVAQQRPGFIARDIDALRQQRPRVAQVLRALDAQRAGHFAVLEVEDRELARVPVPAPDLLV